MLLPIGLFLGAVAMQVALYTVLLPEPTDMPRPQPGYARPMGVLAYGLAYGLSVLRSPFGLAPYLVKMAGALLIRVRYPVNANHDLMEVARILGDFANWGLTTLLVLCWASLPPASALVVMLSSGAELIRLITEKGQMVFSAAWQCLPHRAIAQALVQLQITRPATARWLRPLKRYCRYYALSEAARLAYVLAVLKAQAEPGLAQKFRYVRAFRVVPTRQGLRAGRVRDVARGEVFIHQRWTNDPWLLIGQALRRAPWMFDPRHLRRPFYYRTESNRLATLLVLQHAWLCWPYAVYQFGHEIKAARYDLGYRLLRGLGLDLEARVGHDGTYAFDPLLRWLETTLGAHSTASAARLASAARPLCTDAEALAEIRQRLAQGERLSPLAIAAQYTYPLSYVEEVLWAKIVQDPD
jgi:hypothetical protein